MLPYPFNYKVSKTKQSKKKNTVATRAKKSIKKGKG